MQDYVALAELRYQIRRFVRFSEEVCRNTGLKPQQHQLMLTLKGLPEGTRPSVGDIARRLQIKHHSTVELIDRLVARGVVRRHRGEADKRRCCLLWPARERTYSESFHSNIWPNFACKVPLSLQP